ncbi:MAG: iron ABC transporter permease [Planctomycetota bacterium]|nr:iron ABC transporter permease [Planctomycetota bacterium]
MERGPVTPGRFAIVAGALGAVLAVSCLAGICAGSTGLSAIVSREPGASGILWDLRLPRVLLGALVGAGLCAAGASLQCVLRNPLADPFILGVSGGAAFGAVLVIVSGGGSLSAGAGAFAGALATMMIVYGGGAYGANVGPHGLLLTGVVVNALMGAAVTFLTLMADFTRSREAHLWLMGQMRSPSPAEMILPAAGVLAGCAYMWSLSKQLNVVHLGEDEAASIGVDAAGLSVRVFVATSFVTAAIISLAGPIGFVGFLVPHIVRTLLGADMRLLLPASSLAGASFVVLADAFGRSAMPPNEIPVGIITALCGAPAFLWLLRRREVYR